MAHSLLSNVVSMPGYGKAIELTDQGVYYALNQSTGQVHSVFRLVYEGDWYLYRLMEADAHGEVTWGVMADAHGAALDSMTSEQMTVHFSKPEFAEPRGAWQVLYNGRFGFGKFTPLNDSHALRFALLVFDEQGMRMPILIHKLEDKVEAPVPPILSLA